MKTDQIVLADGLVAFLEARIAEDELVAEEVRAIEEGHGSVWMVTGMDSPLRAGDVSGARLVAECRAKRLVIARLRQAVADQDRNAEEHAAEMRRPRRPPLGSSRVPPDPPTRVPQLRSFGWELSGRKQGLFLALIALAQPYSEYPDFQEVWLVR